MVAMGLTTLTEPERNQSHHEDSQDETWSRIKTSPLHIHTTLTHNKTSQLGEQPPDLLLEDEEATSSVPSIKVDRFGLASGDGLQ